MSPQPQRIKEPSFTTIVCFLSSEVYSKYVASIVNKKSIDKQDKIKNENIVAVIATKGLCLVFL